jgi:hypothetical protein
LSDWVTCKWCVLCHLNAHNEWLWPHLGYRVR